MNFKAIDLNKSFFIVNLVILTFTSVLCKKFSENEKPAWAKKDIRDYSDADLERLFDQWEEDDEPLPEDELPEHLRKPQQVDMSKLDFSDPENVLRLTKKGKTLMMFVTVRGNPSKTEVESITTLWQSSLMNNHLQVERFLIDDHRAIFMFKDGSQAWEAKDYLIEQEQCEEVTIDNKSYYGKYSEKRKQESTGKDKKDEL